MKMIQLRTTVPGRVPTAAQLEQGELALNLPDHALFSKDDSDTVFQIGLTPGNFADVAFTGDYADLLNKPVIPPAYVLPTATTTTLGGVKQGLGVSIAGDGTLTAAVQSVNSKTGVVELTAEDVGADIVLGTDGKLLASVIPDYLLGNIAFIDNWNADTNTPTIPAANTVPAGSYYIVGVPGNTIIDGTGNWLAGDLVISNGTTWSKVQATNTVASVNGKTGAVVLVANDISGISTVGKTGSWNDLLDKPVIPSPYTLPAATTSTLGGVSVGSGLDVSASGVLSVSNDVKPPPKFAVSVIGIVNSGTAVADIIFTETVQFPASFSGSRVGLRESVPGAITGQLRKGATIVGQFNIVASQTVGSFSVSTASTFNAGEMLTVVLTSTPPGVNIGLALTLVSV